MILRRLNETGLVAFRRNLADCRENPAAEVRCDLLTSPEHSTEIGEQIEVEARSFSTRGEAARYLNATLSSLADFDVEHDAGLWSWLALFYFDQLCPPHSGSRTVRNSYHYIFEPRNRRHFYRHLLFVGWKALKVDDRNCRLFLNGPVNRLDKVSEEVMKRLYLTRIPCMFELLDRLYWDEKRGRARAGIVSPEKVAPGDLVHRLPIRIRQLEKTYDLMSLNADQLLELLGDEFSFASSRPAELFD